MQKAYACFLYDFEGRERLVAAIQALAQAFVKVRNWRAYRLAYLLFSALLTHSNAYSSK